MDPAVACSPKKHEAFTRRVMGIEPRHELGEVSPPPGDPHRGISRFVAERCEAAICRPRMAYVYKAEKD